jgi:hypothetical protein
LNTKVDKTNAEAVPVFVKSNKVFYKQVLMGFMGWTVFFVLMLLTDCVENFFHKLTFFVSVVWVFCPVVSPSALEKTVVVL